MKITFSSVFVGILIGTVMSLLLNHKPQLVTAKGQLVNTQKTQSLPNFTTLAESLRPSVVNIVAFRKKRHVSFFRDPFYSVDQATGSGVFIDAQGHIATNNHVIEEAQKITVTLHDGQQFNAKLIGRDVRTDLAVIKIISTHTFNYASFADDEAKVGSWVIAIGSPLGFRHTVTQGIVSAVGRKRTQSSRSVFGYANFVQTSAAINPGNSGGPLIGLDGKIAGINTAIASKTGGFQGIGLAIPAKLAKKVCQEIITHGYVPYAWIGVVLADFKELNDRFKKTVGVDENSKGIIILETIKGATVTKSNHLKENDILLKINSKDIHDSSTFRYELSQHRPKETLELKILRNNKPITVSLVLEERPEKIRDSIVYENRKKKIVD